MKKLLLLAALAGLSINWTVAQTPTPTINGTPPPFVFTGAVTQTGQTFNFTGGTVTTVSVVSANGSAVLIIPYTVYPIT